MVDDVLLSKNLPLTMTDNDDNVVSELLTL